MAQLFTCLAMVAGAARAAAPPAPAADTSFYATRFPQRPAPAALSALGRELFFDRRLSASGRMACASCHDPAHAYGQPDARAVQSGGGRLDQPGLRAVPSLRYLQGVPPFAEHTFDESKDESVDQGPTGGRTWDGRVASAHEQASMPLLSPFEMANHDMNEVVGKVKNGPYASHFRRAFGATIFKDSRIAAAAILLSLEVFQQEPAEFYPYSSKYDEYLRGRAALSPQEIRGLALFESPLKGNCASCHPDRVAGGALPSFTDFGYAALGVPRNPEIPANADPAYHDLGLCGPLRTDLADRPEYCGQFRVPTLRNVATRGSFFHNGRFHTLREVLEFYVQRDTQPARWYAREANGAVRKYDDLPSAYHENLQREAPFDRQDGDAPALSGAEIDDLLAFLGTLDDAPAARRLR